LETSKLHSLFLESNAVCTDTRKINTNDMFFALKGANFDGNTYAEKAISSGAKYVVIALTGSNGKTTTKELINVVLSKKYKTTATKGNLNNHIGVPLTLLSMTEDTEIGIVEMGANHQKEIEFLCRIAQPDYGYITNFGKAHLEGFGNQRNRCSYSFYRSKTFCKMHLQVSRD